MNRNAKNNNSALRFFRDVACGVVALAAFLSSFAGFHAEARSLEEQEQERRESHASRIRFAPEWERYHALTRYLQLPAALLSGNMIKPLLDGAFSPKEYNLVWGLGSWPINRLKKRLSRTLAKAGDFEIESLYTSAGNGFAMRYPVEKFGFPFGLNVLPDPGVVETTFRVPLTQSQFEKVEATIQNDLLTPASRMGIRRSKVGGIAGADHLNMDIATAFGENALLARNFLVDFANHSELASGILNEVDGFNSRALTAGRSRNPMTRWLYNRAFTNLLNPDWLAMRRKKFIGYPRPYRDVSKFFEGKRESMKEFLSDFDANWENGKRLSTARVLGDYHALVNLGLEHHDAISVRNPNSDTRARLEIRSVRPQSTDGYKRLTKLIAARVGYLSSFVAPIPFENRDPITGKKEGAIAFHRYVTECGLDWREYVDFIPKKYRKYFIEAGKQGERNPAPKELSTELPPKFVERLKRLGEARKWRELQNEIERVPVTQRALAGRQAAGLLIHGRAEEDRGDVDFFLQDAEGKEFRRFQAYLTRLEDPKTFESIGINGHVNSPLPELENRLPNQNKTRCDLSAFQ